MALEVQVLADLFDGVFVPKAVGEVERAEPPRFQSIGGNRQRHFNLVLYAKIRRSGRNHQRDT